MEWYNGVLAGQYYWQVGLATLLLGSSIFAYVLHTYPEVFEDRSDFKAMTVTVIGVAGLWPLGLPIISMVTVGLLLYSVLNRVRTKSLERMEVEDKLRRSSQF